MAAYWPKLERAQALADRALVKGLEVQADLSSAKSRLSTADSWVTRANKEADKYKEDKDAGKDVPKPDEAKVRAATRDATNAQSAQSSAQVVAEIDPLGGTVRTAYDAHHHLISSTDQVENTTRAVNNQLGQPTEVTRPDGTVVRFTYNDLNLITAIDLPDGTTWRYAYDERGNCVAATDPEGRTARSAYSAAYRSRRTGDSRSYATKLTLHIILDQRRLSWLAMWKPTPHFVNSPLTFLQYSVSRLWNVGAEYSLF
ncbi:hypothetical protein [Streptomyces sp. 2A115]|uniref:hypothetical protein n=1 Tax=Streptomyces sp. 2A115 TaxID=3457439 RepID=UPI003FD5E36F